MEQKTTYNKALIELLGQMRITLVKDSLIRFDELDNIMNEAFKGKWYNVTSFSFSYGSNNFFYGIRKDINILGTSWETKNGDMPQTFVSASKFLQESPERKFNIGDKVKVDHRTLSNEPTEFYSTGVIASFKYNIDKNTWYYKLEGSNNIEYSQRITSSIDEKQYKIGEKYEFLIDEVQTENAWREGTLVHIFSHEGKKFYISKPGDAKYLVINGLIRELKVKEEIKRWVNEISEQSKILKDLFSSESKLEKMESEVKKLRDNLDELIINIQLIL